MKLYTDHKGRWAGTQSDAKQFGDFEQVEVPTDKPTLLEFLNEHRVGDANVEDVGPDSEPPLPRNRLSQTDQINLKAAYDNAGLAREYLRRVYHKVGEDEE